MSSEVLIYLSYDVQSIVNWKHDFRTSSWARVGEQVVKWMAPACKESAIARNEIFRHDRRYTCTSFVRDHLKIE